MYELDGLRGWAAISVVFYHLLWETFSALFPWVHNPLFATFITGKFAVCIFFVLSGEALSSGYFAGKGEVAVARIALWRYFRLTIPVLVISLVVWCLYRLHFIWNVEAARIVRREDWLGAWLNFPVTLPYVAKFAALSTIFQCPSDKTLNEFLWTMSVEMRGSIIVFTVLFVYRWLPIRPQLAVVAIIVLSLNSQTRLLADFVVGMAFASMRNAGKFAELQSSSAVQRWSWPVIWGTAALQGILLWNRRGDSAEPLLASVLLLAIFSNRACCAFFSNNFSRRLGILSFPIYLSQFPVIVSLMSLLIVLARARGPITPAVTGAIVLISFAACVLAAIPLIWLERLNRYLGQTLPRIVLREKRTPIPQT
jgi:peptidoglycan/LPS O-acetylase OafA/YrhL